LGGLQNYFLEVRTADIKNKLDEDADKNQE